MKHTLQSLLIITVLTLPTAFGETLDLSGDSAAVPEKESSSIVEISTRPQPPIYRLHKDILEVIFGLAHNVENDKKLHPGFTNLQALKALALTCSGLSDVAQSMLREVRKIDVVHRLLQGGVPTPYDAGILTFLGINTAAPFDNVLNAAFAVKSWMKKMGPERTALVAAINRHPTFTDNQKIILSGLLPNATTLDIKRAASRLRVRGTAYHDKAAAFFERVVQHPGATAFLIQRIARELRDLGTAYYPKAAVLFELSANHVGATADDIRSAATGFYYLGSAYYPKAAALYEKSAHHVGATADDICEAAHEVFKLGTAYHKSAAKLYELAAQHRKATRHYIRSAADGLRDLGSTYPEGSAERTDYQTRAEALRKKLVPSN